MLSVVTGKPLAIGGSLGRVEATGRGVFFCLAGDARAPRRRDRGPEDRDPGLRQRRLAVRAVRRRRGRDRRRGLRLERRRATTASGLDVAALLAHKARGGRIAEFAGGEAVSNEELLELACDVLAPCALELVLTEANADRVKARIVLEGANGPTTPDADAILEANGVLVVPDVLANAGGVVVSYFEWVQGLQELFWTESEVNERLRRIVVERLPRDLGPARGARASRCGLAAYGLAVRRVAEASTIRGLYP